MPRAADLLVTLLLAALVLAAVWLMRPFYDGSFAEGAARAACKADYARARNAADTAAADRLVRYPSKQQAVAPVSCGVYRNAGLLR